MDRDKISICIPAYKRIDFLKRLLNSIVIQSYRNFEVIVSDDSPGEEVFELVNIFRSELPSIIYHRNLPALGTPENWNKAISLASGFWIKIMHDDDWFDSPQALEKFASKARHSNASFIFSAYNNVYISNERKVSVRPSNFRIQQLKVQPVTLLSRNIIGPPSVILCRNDKSFPYDGKLKWLVDIDMYIRRLKTGEAAFIPDILVNVGVGDEQVTASVHGHPSVEIPEHFYFISKFGISSLRHILVYDYWWRFFRNFKIRSVDDIRKQGVETEIHKVFLRMISWQVILPYGLLRIGVFSKVLMAIHFSLNRSKLPK